MKEIALVHDWLVSFGGAESTLEAISELYPCPIYTLIYNRKAFEDRLFSKKQIHTSLIQKLPFLFSFYRNYFPFFPYAIEQLDLREFRVILSSSHSVAKGILTDSKQLHICYCHTPMRYAWDLKHEYLNHLGILKKIIARPILNRMKQWDLSNSDRVDHFIANSQYVAQRIARHYRRKATVIYPPVNTEAIPLKTKKEDFYLTVSRLVPYKKIDLIVETFNRMPGKRLIVIGEGPDLAVLKKKAKKNIELLGYQSTDKVYHYLSFAKAFVFAALEDFGIAPVEAQAAGTPVIGFGEGGLLETVVENQTGVFFSEQNTESLMRAVRQFEKRQDQFDPTLIRRHALQFSKRRFQCELKTFIEEKIHENPHFSRRQRKSSMASFYEKPS